MTTKTNGVVTPQELLQIYAKSRLPLVGIASPQEELILAGIDGAARGMNPPMGLSWWSVISGLGNYDQEAKLPDGNPKFAAPATNVGKQGDPITDPTAAVIELTNTLSNEKMRGFVVFLDVQPYLERPDFRRALSELRMKLKTVGADSLKVVVLLAPNLRVPDDLADEVAILDWPLPDRKAVGQILTRTVNTNRNNPKLEAALPEPNEPAFDECVSAAMGLTHEQAENAFCRTLTEKRRLDVKTISREKKQIIEASGMLGWEEPGATMDSLGGLDNLKAWCHERSEAFTAEAREWGLPTPAGVILVGVPGTGKSLSARVFAATWNVPLLRARSPLSKYVGESQERTRQMCKVVETVAPCVLWIDEIEKFFAGAGGSGESDGGTSRQVFGIILEKMQDWRDKGVPVFVFGTANDISGLPPELLRRFDERFFLDLPSHDDRKAIATAVIKRYRSPNVINNDKALVDVAGASSEFTGAEIEEAYRSACFLAFANGKRPVTAADWKKALGQMVPIAETMKERIGALRDWAKTRCRQASSGGKKVSVLGSTERQLEI